MKSPSSSWNFWRSCKTFCALSILINLGGLAVRFLVGVASLDRMGPTVALFGSSLFFVECTSVIQLLKCYQNYLIINGVLYFTLCLLLWNELITKGVWAAVFIAIWVVTGATIYAIVKGG